MTRAQLHRAVARATGESVREIARRGFTIADPVDTNYDPEPSHFPPHMIDWDEYDLHRNIAVVEQRGAEPACA